MMPLHTEMDRTRGISLVEAVTGCSKKSRIMLGEALEWYESIDHFYICKDCKSTKTKGVFVWILSSSDAAQTPYYD
jgi:hypothetical protein